MCGIAGFVTVQPSDSPSIIERMTDTIRHRGPDDSGYYRDPWASLGFRRLAIIDVAGGHQPMANEDSSHFIIFNGEIFNHGEGRYRQAGSGEPSGRIPRPRSAGAGRMKKGFPE